MAFTSKIKCHSLEYQLTRTWVGQVDGWRPGLGMAEGGKAESGLMMRSRYIPPIWYRPDSLFGPRLAKCCLLSRKRGQRGGQQRCVISHVRMDTHGRTSNLFSCTPGKSGTTTSHSIFLGASVVAMVLRCVRGAGRAATVRAGILDLLIVGMMLLRAGKVEV
jgi:hypothetical protein